LPALRPDVVLLHAPMADRAGNIYVGVQREFFAMAHAAAKTVVTVEKLYDGDLLSDPLLAAATLPGFYVEAVAVEPRGAWPLPLPGYYAIDTAHMAEYARLAATAEGFTDYLQRHVYGRGVADLPVGAAATEAV
jgi:glutaconate CoA-transferase subunit A